MQTVDGRRPGDEVHRNSAIKLFVLYNSYRMVGNSRPISDENSGSKPRLCVQVIEVRASLGLKPIPDGREILRRSG